MSVSTEVCPAAHSATCPAAMSPRVVRTPVTRSPSVMNPVTSQSWMMSTPACVGAAGETPRDVVVLGDAGARLVGRPEHRVADVVRDVHDRADLLDLVGRRPTPRRSR